jgi:translation initiation factor IF-2
LVAITKIDKPNANIEMVKSQMSEQGLIPEERGGDIPFIALSSVT